jgi:hypothetical protein
VFVSGIELRFLVHVRRLISKRYTRERRNGIKAEVKNQEGRNVEAEKCRMSLLLVSVSTTAVAEYPGRRRLTKR